MDSNEEPEVAKKIGILKWIPSRYLVALAATLLNAVFYLMRFNTSVTIVAIALDTESDAPHYDWNSAERSAVLSSFFWGYTAMQLVAMFIARWLGPRRIVIIMSLLSSVFTVLFVPMAALGWQGACVSRIALGVSQSGLMASVNHLLAHWAPAPERAKMIVLAFCGQQIGTILAFAVSGVISEKIGWPWVFYISGILGVILAAVWFWVVEDTPAQHRWTSPKERLYIESSISESKEGKHLKNLKVPWRAILTSIPFWTLLITQVANSWGYWTLLSGIPSYMDGVLGFDLSENGLLSALPYFAMFISNFILLWISDKCLDHKFWSVTVARKIGCTIGMLGPAAALMTLSFIENDPTISVLVLTLGQALGAGSLVGTGPNYIDLAHNFASVMMGIVNQFGCVTGIVAPLVTGFIVTDNESASQWHTVFLITAGLLIAGNILFLSLGSAVEQPWNNPERSRTASFVCESDNETEEPNQKGKE